jgi:hypothetical protein
VARFRHHLGDAVVALESQGVGTIPVRSNMGGTYSEPQALRSLSFTHGVAYSF